jgi:hypothetical protein
MTYVVMVKPPDDHPGMVRVYGGFRSLAKADAFAEKIRQLCDDDPGERYGYAYVQQVRTPRITEAQGWALAGEGW